MSNKTKRIFIIISLILIVSCIGVFSKYIIDEKTNKLELTQDTNERLVLTTEEASSFDPKSLIKSSSGDVKILTTIDPESTYEQSLVYQSTKGWNKIMKVVNVLVQPSLEGPDIILNKKVFEVEKDSDKVNIQNAIKSVTSRDGEPITNINTKIYPENHKTTEKNLVYFTSKFFDITTIGSYDVNIHAIDEDGNESVLTIKVDIILPKEADNNDTAVITDDSLDNDISNEETNNNNGRPNNGNGSNENNNTNQGNNNNKPNNNQGNNNNNNNNGNGSSNPVEPSPIIPEPVPTPPENPDPIIPEPNPMPPENPDPVIPTPVDPEPVLPTPIDPNSSVPLN